VRIRSSGLEAAPATVKITFAGAPVQARATDTVASTLVAAGELACRETLDGDTRGLFCGMGVCQECLVAVDGEPGMRACMTPVRDGMTVERQPARPDLASLHAAAGAATSDAVPLAAPGPPASPAHERACDLLVVGGGPAGLAAAVAAAEAGLDVVLADERAKPGGQYYKQPGDALIADEGRLDAQYRSGRRLIARAREAGVELLSGLQIWGAPRVDELLARDADGVDWTLRPQKLIAATGAYERGVPVPGWTLPGVMTTGAAQTLLRAYQVSPGTRVLVSGNGPLNMQVAAELVRGGAKVVALAELARLTDPRRAPALARMAASAPDLIVQGAGYGAALARARVPVLHGRALIRAEGDGRVQRATLAKIDASGRAVPGSEKTYEVDAVCVGFGFLPSNELARSLGAAHVYDRRESGFVVERSSTGRTSVDGLWVVGDGGGIGGARVAQAAGTLAGLDVVRSLGRPVPAAQVAGERAAAKAHARARRFQDALWTAYEAPRLVDQLAAPDTPICRCENVPLAAVEEAFDAGLGHIGAVKRVTRAGMGGCQGRYCGGLLAELAARREGRAPQEHDLFAPSAPFKPQRIRDLSD
jgi:NADPH-dependent 2,4-dienoyl-CoA reductase/sulfur reductase-like enzyme